MPVSISGSGTISGVSVGGLPDGIVDTDMLAAKAATSAKLGNGTILQVVSTTKTDAFTTNASAGSPAGITGLSVSITPASTSNKILLTAHIGHTTTSNDNYASFFYFYRGGSVISGAIGDAAGSNRRSAFYQRGRYKYHGTAASMVHLDSPSSTSALTYQVYCSVEGSGGYAQVNRSGSTDTADHIGRTISTLTAMEVAA